MTVVAWDGKTVSADQLCDFHGIRVQKIVKCPDGSIVGAAGAGNMCRAALIWFAGGCNGPQPWSKPEDVQLLRVYHDRAEFWSQGKGEPIPVLPPFAIGSGGEYAMGAMLAGASAPEAVKIAIIGDTGCGGGTMSMKPSKKPLR